MVNYFEEVHTSGILTWPACLLGAGRRMGRDGEGAGVIIPRPQ